MNRGVIPTSTELQQGELRLRLALEAGGLGIWEWDPVTDTMTCDDRLEAMFGLAPGTAPSSFDAWLALTHPDDRDHITATVQAALEASGDFEVVYRVVTEDAGTRWLRGQGRIIHHDGQALGMIGVTSDVTEQRAVATERDKLLNEESVARASAAADRDRLQFLIEAKATLSEAIDLDGCLDRLAEVSIPRLADGSAVHLLGPDGEPVLVAIHHREPDKIELVQDLFDRYPVRLHHPGIGTALRAGTSGWIPEITDEMITQAARSDEHLAMLRSLQLTAGLVVPLRGAEGVFGAITFITDQGRHMSTEDIQLVEQLVSRVAVLLRNAQLMELREMDRRASRYQAALLQTMVEAGVDGILAVSPDGEVLWHNQRFLQLWALDEDLIEKGDTALIAAARQRVVRPQEFSDAVAASYRDRPVHRSDEVELVDGKVLERHGSSLFGPDGEYLGFLWSFRDVTLDRARTHAIAEAGKRSALLARTLQHSLLPPKLPRIAGVDLAARYHAAGEGLEVGGDFYDVFPVGDDWMLVVGDVCGTGAEAASITALARYTIRAAANHADDPAAAITELNQVMVNDTDFASGQSRFATVCCIRLRVVDDGLAVDVACGGHPPPVLLRADGTAEEFGVPGTLVGVFPTLELTTVHTVLAPGDTLIAYTDGVIEARGEDRTQFDVEGIYRSLGPLAGRPAHELVKALETAVLDLQGGTSHDDIAILVAQATDEIRP